MIFPPFFSAFIFTFNAAAFIATSTSHSSPGVKIGSVLMRNWKPLTPGSVPIGARISAGKSGNVARSRPNSALLLVNWLPVNCIPSPLSPANFITTSANVSCISAIKNQNKNLGEGTKKGLGILLNT